MNCTLTETGRDLRELLSDLICPRALSVSPIFKDEKLKALDEKSQSVQWNNFKTKKEMKSEGKYTKEYLNLG